MTNTNSSHFNEQAETLFRKRDYNGDKGRSYNAEGSGRIVLFRTIKSLKKTGGSKSGPFFYTNHYELNKQFLEWLVSDFAL